MSEQDPVRVAIYLDDSPEPIGSYRPPASFELDTKLLPDGPHRLLIKATDSAGVEGVREVRFIVRNGPGIAVMGLTNGDIVEGKIPILVNAYSGTSEEQWEPRRAETPAPIPTWSWVLFLLVVAWAMFYWFATWTPSPQYANSPTFSSAAAVAAAAVETAERRRAAPGAGEFAWAELGARVYEQRCQICHAASGEGVPNFVPTLRGSRIVVADDPTEHLRRVLLGSGGVAPAAGRRWKAWMPGFAEVLSDEEVAAVANHERSSWGNSARTVRPEQAGTVRSESRASNPASGTPSAAATNPGSPPTPLARSAGGTRLGGLGGEIYAGRCQPCHTASGGGIPDYAPSLVGSTVVTADDPSTQVRQILFGSGGVERGPDYPWMAWMPAFGELFSDKEVAAVANYERSSWGNSARPVRPEQVRAVREASAAAR